jgi:hypothetical protein
MHCFCKINYIVFFKRVKKFLCIKIQTEFRLFRIFSHFGFLLQYFMLDYCNYTYCCCFSHISSVMVFLHFHFFVDDKYFLWIKIYIEQTFNFFFANKDLKFGTHNAFMQKGNEIICRFVMLKSNVKLILKKLN